MRASLLLLACMCNLQRDHTNIYSRCALKKPGFCMYMLLWSCMECAFSIAIVFFFFVSTSSFFFYCCLLKEDSIEFWFLQEIFQVLFGFNLIKVQQDYKLSQYYKCFVGFVVITQEFFFLLTNLQNIFHTVRFQQFESFTKT